MKYLQSYLKLYERLIKSNVDDIKENIKDILLPISDMGYEIEVTDNVEDIANLHKKINQDYTGKEILLNSLTIRVVRFATTPLKMSDEVGEEFIRMKEYLESECFNSILVYYTTMESIQSRSLQSSVLNPPRDFNEFIVNSFELELPQLLFVAKTN
jgi:hypothetical protein